PRDGASLHPQPAKFNGNGDVRVFPHRLHEQPDAAAAIGRLAERAIDPSRRDDDRRIGGAHPVDRGVNVAVADALAVADDHRGVRSLADPIYGATAALSILTVSVAIEPRKVTAGTGPIPPASPSPPGHSPARPRFAFWPRAIRRFRAVSPSPCRRGKAWQARDRTATGRPEAADVGQSPCSAGWLPPVRPPGQAARGRPPAVPRTGRAPGSGEDRHRAGQAPRVRCARPAARRSGSSGSAPPPSVPAPMARRPGGIPPGRAGSPPAGRSRARTSAPRHTRLRHRLRCPKPGFRYLPGAASGKGNCAPHFPARDFRLDRKACAIYTTSMTEEPNDHQIVPATVSEPLSRAIGERYLTYALSTIMHRALPDARDGLKPVHRRILFAMRELKLAPTGGFRKSAKISGDVMGNYHPHGDAAIYDAMARLAQWFNMRYPLVDGQGNYGNIDGDGPAASRYTEARLTAAAEALMEGLAENAVDFRPNYDGTLTEPEVLPAAFPNLLANGSSGIAVGMATNIPPHNLHELIDACLHLIKAPNADDAALLAQVPGPDFPTGGVIVEPRENILEAYRTGRGSFRTRARWAVEDQGRGTWQIVVTEIPFQVQKS